MAREPESSLAHDYMRHIMEAYNEAAPPSTSEILAARKRFNQLLDGEMKSAATSARKKQLKALGAGSVHLFDSLAGNRSETALETFHDLVDIATGVRNRDGLAPVQPRTKQRTASEDWRIAAAIFAIRHASPVTSELEKRIHANTGKTVTQIRKIADNMDQGKGSYDLIKTNIRDIEARHDNGEMWMLEDLLP